jgi:hypothetical protein
LPTYGSQIAKQMEIDVYTIRNVVWEGEIWGMGIEDKISFKRYIDEIKCTLYSFLIRFEIVLSKIILVQSLGFFINISFFHFYKLTPIYVLKRRFKLRWKSHSAYEISLSCATIY